MGIVLLMYYSYYLYTTDNKQYRDDNYETSPFGTKEYRGTLHLLPLILRTRLQRALRDVSWAGQLVLANHAQFTQDRTVVQGNHEGPAAGAETTPALSFMSQCSVTEWRHIPCRSDSPGSTQPDLPTW